SRPRARSMSYKVETPVDPRVTAAGNLLLQLAGDRKMRPQVLGLIKQVAPDQIIPELEIAEDIDRRFQERDQKKDEAITSLSSKVDDLTRAISRDRWRRDHGLSEEELLEVETFAKDRKIGDGDSALEFYQLSRPALGNPRGTPGPFEGMTDEDKKGLLKNP